MRRLDGPLADHVFLVAGRPDEQHARVPRRAAALARRARSGSSAGGRCATDRRRAARDRRASRADMHAPDANPASCARAGRARRGSRSMRHRGADLRRTPAAISAMPCHAPPRSKNAGAKPASSRRRARRRDEPLGTRRRGHRPVMNVQADAPRAAAASREPRDLLRDRRARTASAGGHCRRAPRRSPDRGP